MGKVAELNKNSLDKKTQETNQAQKRDKLGKVQFAVEVIKDKFELWYSNNKGYLTTDEGHFSLNDTRLKRFAQHYLYSVYGRQYSSSQLADVLQLLETLALHEGTEYLTSNRFYKENDTIYIDISPDNGVLKVTADHVGYVHDIPCRFLKSKNQKPWLVDLANPMQWIDIYDLFGIYKQSYRSIIRAFMLGSMNANINFPILQIVGGQGSGKSTLAEFIKQTIDPSGITIKQAPGKEDDVIASISSEHLTAFDNLNSLSNSQQDMLCRISTGSTYSKRMLYSDNDSFDVNIRKPIILTALYPVVTNSDLIDRSLHFRKTKPSERISEEELRNTFNTLAPRIRGRLIYDLQFLLNSSDNNYVKVGRMAGFERFVSGIPTLGDVISQSRAIRREQAEMEIMEDELLHHIYDSVIDTDLFETTTVEIKDCLEEMKTQTTKAISVRLEKSRGLFHEIGIQTDFSDKHPIQRRRLYRFINKSENHPSDPSHSSSEKLKI